MLAGLSYLAGSLQSRAKGNNLDGPANYARLVAICSISVRGPAREQREMRYEPRATCTDDRSGSATPLSCPIAHFLISLSFTRFITLRELSRPIWTE